MPRPAARGRAGRRCRSPGASDARRSATRIPRTSASQRGRALSAARSGTPASTAAGAGDGHDVGGVTGCWRAPRRTAAAAASMKRRWSASVASGTAPEPRIDEAADADVRDQRPEPRPRTASRRADQPTIRTDGRPASAASPAWRAARLARAAARASGQRPAPGSGLGMQDDDGHVGAHRRKSRARAGRDRGVATRPRLRRPRRQPRRCRRRRWPRPSARSRACPACAWRGRLARCTRPLRGA